MPSGHSINLFEFRITTRNKPDDFQYLDNFDGNGSDVLHVFARFLQALPSDRLVSRGKKHFGKPVRIQQRGRTVRATVKCGTSGVRSNITDRNGSLKATREELDIEDLTFRLCFCAPANGNVGFLALEEIHSRTLTVEFRDEFVNQFKIAYRRQLLAIKPCALEDAWTQAEDQANAMVQGIRILRTEPGRSVVSETSGLGSLPQSVAKIETSLDYSDSPFPARTLRRLRDELDQKRGRARAAGVRTVDTVDDADLEDIDVVADVVLPDGEHVKARYSNTRPPRISFDIEAPVGVEVTDEVFYPQVRRHIELLVSQSGGVLPTNWWDSDWIIPGTVPNMHIEVDHEPDTEHLG